MTTASALPSSAAALLLRAGHALARPRGQVLLWSIFIFFFASLLLQRNTLAVDYETFLDAGKSFLARDPQDPVYEAGNGFYNPIWVAALLGPLGVLPDRALAIQIWRLVEVLILVAAAFLWLDLLPPPHRLLWSSLSVVFFPAWQGVEYSQVVGLMVLGYSLVHKGLAGQRRLPLVFGAVLLTAKPNLTAVPLLALFAFLLVAGCWQEAALIAGALLTVMLLPALWHPGWIGDWAASIRAVPPGLFHEPTNLFQLAYSLGGVGIALTVGALLFLLALALGIGLFRSRLPRSTVLGVLSVLGILASPQVAYLYDLTLLLPALWALMERPATYALALLLLLFPIALAFIGNEVWAILYACGAAACLLVGLRVGSGEAATVGALRGGSGR